MRRREDRRARVVPPGAWVVLAVFSIVPILGACTHSGSEASGTGGTPGQGGEPGAGGAPGAGGTRTPGGGGVTGAGRTGGAGSTNAVRKSPDWADGFIGAKGGGVGAVAGVATATVCGIVGPGVGGVTGAGGVGAFATTGFGVGAGGIGLGTTSGTDFFAGADEAIAGLVTGATVAAAGVAAGLFGTLRGNGNSGTTTGHGRGFTVYLMNLPWLATRTVTMGMRCLPMSLRMR